MVCSGLPAFGMVKTPSSRVRKFRITWRTVRPWRWAIVFQHAASGRTGPRELRPAERRVAHERDPVFLAVGDQFAFDAAFAEVIEHLVRREFVMAERGLRRPQSGDIEIAHAGEADAAFVDEVFHGAHGLADGVIALPVEEIEIQAIGAEALKGALARAQGAFVARIGGQDFACQEYLVAPAGDGLAGDLFGTSVAIHLGGIDVGETEIDARAQGVDGAALGVRRAFDHPGALSDDGDLHTGPAEGSLCHVS